jgi:hypothetical protein
MSRIELAPEVADDLDRILGHLVKHGVAVSLDLSSFIYTIPFTLISSP